MQGAHETDVVVDINILLRPHIEDHTFRAVRSACAAAVSDKVISASVQPTSIGVVAVSAVVLKSRSKIIAHRHEASLNLPWGLVFSGLGSVSETCRALLFFSLLLVRD